MVFNWTIYIPYICLLVGPSALFDDQSMVGLSLRWRWHSSATQSSAVSRNLPLLNRRPAQISGLRFSTPESTAVHGGWFHLQRVRGKLWLLSGPWDSVAFSVLQAFVAWLADDSLVMVQFAGADRAKVGSHWSAPKATYHPKNFERFPVKAIEIGGGRPPHLRRYVVTCVISAVSVVNVWKYSTVDGRTWHPYNCTCQLHCEEGRSHWRLFHPLNQRFG